MYMSYICVDHEGSESVMESYSSTLLYLEKYSNYCAPYLSVDQLILDRKKEGELQS